MVTTQCLQYTWPKIHRNTDTSDWLVALVTEPLQAARNMPSFTLGRFLAIEGCVKQNNKEIFPKNQQYTFLRDL